MTKTKVRDRTRLKWFEPSSEAWAKMKGYHRKWIVDNYPKRISLNHLATEVFEEAVRNL